MNNPKGVAIFWLLIMLTAIKLFSIIFLCTLTIDVEKLILFKYKGKAKISQQTIVYHDKQEELLTKFKSYVYTYYKESMII